MIIFGVDNTSVTYVNNRKKDLLIIVLDLTDKMNDTTVKAEKERSINITKSKKGIGLSVHDSWSKSNIFASRSIIHHFRAKTVL